MKITAQNIYNTRFSDFGDRYFDRAVHEVSNTLQTAVTQQRVHTVCHYKLMFIANNEILLQHQEVNYLLAPTIKYYKITQNIEKWWVVLFWRRGQVVVEWLPCATTQSDEFESRWQNFLTFSLFLSRGLRVRYVRCIRLSHGTGSNTSAVFTKYSTCSN